MLVNMCTDLSGVTVRCNCVSVKGNEPQNLVSSESTLRSYGFRAERYVRGPVIVSIDLTCMKVATSIAAIVLRCAMRENTSCVVDVFISDGDLEKFIGRLSFGGPTNTIPIGSLVRDRDVCVFDLASVVKGSYVSEALELNKTSQNIQMQNTHFMKRGVKSLSVKISNLRGGISAGLSWLEIWSECRSAPYVIPPSLPSIYTGAAIRNLYACQGEEATPVQVTVTRPINSCSSEETPSEFLDQLTFELMNNPVTLPSGNTVDMESIHKLFSQDKSPVDPFTGLSLGEFTAVTNVILRDKINKFRSLKSGDEQMGYTQSSSNKSEESSQIPTTVELREIRNKRITYFENEASVKRNKLEVRPHKELLLTTQLPFETTVLESKPKYETIDLTTSEDSS